MRRVQNLIIFAAVWAALVLPIRVAGQAANDRAAVLKTQIDSLRTEGKFADALGKARVLLDIGLADTSSKPFELFDARGYVSTLEFVVGLPASTQEELAKAYGLQAEITEHLQKAEYSEGAKLAEMQLEVFKRVFGHDHRDVAMSLTNLGDPLFEQGDFAGAEPLYREALAIRQKVLGNDHPDVARSLTDLGILLDSKGDYQGAEPLFREALAIQRKAKGNDHLDVAKCLNNLGNLCVEKGDPAAAEPLYREALSIRRNTLGNDHPYVAMSLSNLGILLNDTGDYAGAETLHREALAIFRKALGNDHPNVALSLNNLANLLSDQGDYASAEPLYREALAIERKALGNNDPDLAMGLNNLGVLLFDKGDYAGAEPLYREALAIRQKALGPEHPDVAESLANLGNLLRSKGDFAGAEPLYREALAIQRKALASDSPDVATNLNNLGALLYDQGDYAGAEPLYREALAIERRVLGNDHPHVGRSLNNIGLLLSRQGDFAGAEPLYREALAIQRKALGPNHPSVAETLGNLATLLTSKGDYLGAEETLSSAAEVWEASRLRVGTGTERASFQQSPYPRLALVRLELGKTGEAWPAAERDHGRALADLLFAARARPLTRTESAKEDSLSRTLANLENQVMALENIGSTDSSQTTAADLESARDELFAAQSAWSAFEAKIASKYPVSEGRAYSLAKVQAGLDKRTAILGWLDVDMQGKNDVSSWVYVIRNKGPVVWARLGPPTGQPNDSPIERTRQFRERLALFPWLSRTAESILQTGREQWLERVAPVADALEGATHLVVIPSGAMLGVPVEAMVDETGKSISDRYAVSYAPSATIYTWPRDRAREPEGNSGNRSLLVGDPPFQPDQMAAMEGHENVQEVCLGHTESRGDDTQLRYVLSGNETARGSLQRLPCTRMEIDAIAPLVPDPTLLLGPRASEQELARLAATGELQNFKVIHLATHALVDDEQPERSALILSLVNLPDPLEAAMKGERIYDGLVTAKEIVRDWKLDTDLVVLSACNTGLGKVVGGEGYVGFSHAFLQAGARSLIVSLWKVDDRATSLLMQRFYENWTGRSADPRKKHRGQAMSKAEALQEAKHFVRTYADTSGKQPFEHPCYWAAFILIGERE